MQKLSIPKNKMKQIIFQLHTIIWISNIFLSSSSYVHQITPTTSDNNNKREVARNSWHNDYINFIRIIQNYYNNPSTKSPKLFNNFENNSKLFIYRQSGRKMHLDMSSHGEVCDNEKLLQCQYELSYRNYDGSCNNLENPTWGMAKTHFARLLPSIYSDGIWKPAVAASGNELPPARLLSYKLFPQMDINDPIWTLLTMQWGQIVTHDMSELSVPSSSNLQFVTCCDNNGQLSNQNLDNPQCFPIKIGINDPVYDRQITQCLAFDRSVTDNQIGDCYLTTNNNPDKPAEQMTMVTGFLDLSNLYGSSEKIAITLRSQSGGRLRTKTSNHREWLPPAFIKNSTEFFCNEERPRIDCYAAGDNRVNQNPQLTVLQTMLLREHNRIANILNQINPHWNDETIYQETRRIMIAQHQFITYYEWLPIIIGLKNAFNHKLIYDTNNINYIDDYDKNINPNVLNEHSNGAFRVLHSLIAGYLKLVGESRASPQSTLRLSDWLERPSVIEKANNFDDLTRGLAYQPEQARNQFYDHEITEFLFRERNRLGNDLRSLDIQRNRDHGIATYNDYRELCGLKRAKNWEDFSDYITLNNIKILSQLYEQPDDVDLSVGGGLEINVEGSLSGPTFLCILIEQFYRSRVGDRFWFETSNSVSAFTHEQLGEIRKTTIARFLCDNGDDIRTMQRRAFEQPSPYNPIIKCADLPSMNLSLWKDYTLELPNQSSQHHPSILYKK